MQDLQGCAVAQAKLRFLAHTALARPSARWDSTALHVATTTIENEMDHINTAMRKLGNVGNVGGQLN